MRRKIPLAWFIVLIALYLLATYLVRATSSAEGVITVGNSRIPIAAFTGVFSSLSNLTVIFMAIYFGKAGFVLAMIILLLQYPMLAQTIILQHNLSSIPGIFSNILTMTAVIIFYRRNVQIDRLQKNELVHLKNEQQLSQHLFEQTATALVNAVDAKDTYSHGHSLRVAEYSEQIAKELGKSEEECYQIYYTALLHDVGKIGIADEIITKSGKLTSEEYDVIKQHPIMGNQILSSITEYPYLAIGAHYHHERYDGKGYPDGLKGEDIPEIARIISVADAYDAMTSNRSYRNAIPQQLVREEIVKGAGTQFDPKFAKIMQHLIDMDAEYRMKERIAIKELSGNNELICGEYRSAVSDGIVLTQHLTGIDLNVTAGDGEEESFPALVIFDSLDARIHRSEKTREELVYFEYCEIRFDGETTVTGARKVQSETVVKEDTSGEDQQIATCHIDAVKVKDHALITIDDGTKTVKVTIAFPDNSRFAYIGLTGQNCLIRDVSIRKEEKEVPDDYITRIAEEISYIDAEEGDIPNLQVDGFRSAATEGIPITDGMKIRFHTMSLPTARLIWHCPYLDIFTAKDRRVNGKGFRQYSLIRLDGENWESEYASENKLTANRTEAFEGWDAWKKANKEGFDCEVSFERKGNRIVVTTENLGLSIRNRITVGDGEDEIYVALSGDQCALTNIRIER